MSDKKKPHGIKELLSRVRADRFSLCGGGATDEDIKKLEKKLYIKLPASYVAFLREFDGGEFSFGRMHCLTSSGAGAFDFCREIRDFFKYAPMMGVRSLLPFACSYGGDIYCFDFGDIKNGEPAVVEYDHEYGDDQDLYHRGNNLESFLRWSYDHRSGKDRESEIYISCDTHLVGLDTGSIKLTPADGNRIVVPYYLQSESEKTYKVEFPERLKGYSASALPKPAANANVFHLKQLSQLIDQVLKETNDGKLRLLVFSNGEMSTLDEYKTVIGSMTVFDRTLELTAGDCFQIGPGQAIELIPVAPMPNLVAEEGSACALQCDFCGKTNEEVKKLIAGPTNYICNECIDQCNDIIASEFAET
jgi:hypothetical protein